jgi:hypothetical protein
MAQSEIKQMPHEKQIHGTVYLIEVDHNPWTHHVPAIFHPVEHNPFIDEHTTLGSPQQSAGPADALKQQE